MNRLGEVRMGANRRGTSDIAARGQTRARVGADACIVDRYYYRRALPYVSVVAPLAPSQISPIQCARAT